MTVRDLIASSACGTAPMSGLCRQIIREMLILSPGALVPIAAPQVHAAPHVYQFLQPQARLSLMKVLAERPGVTLILDSAFRVLPAQVALFSWYKEGRCNIPLAAPPGESPHEEALALDLAAPHDWAPAFERHGWVYLGPKDPPHFQYLQPGVRRDLGALGVRAFQTLAARHGISVAVDSVYGPVTRAAALASPCEGWPEE